DFVGVAVMEPDTARIDPQFVGNDLPERGLVALAVVVRADRDRDRAGRIEAYLGVFDQSGARRLDRVRNADAGELAARPRRRPPRREPGIVGLGETVLQVFCEIAAVVGI